jgi:hypothetical protein
VYAGVYDKKEDLHHPECKKPGVTSLNSPTRYSPFLFFYNSLIQERELRQLNEQHTKKSKKKSNLTNKKSIPKKAAIE